MGRYSTKATGSWVARIRDVLSITDGLDVTEEQRKTIQRCMESELIEAIDRYEEVSLTENDGTPWTKEEIAQLTEYLGKQDDSKDYSTSRLILNEARALVHRSAKSVKKKAYELQLGRKIDSYHYDFDL